MDMEPPTTPTQGYAQEHSALLGNATVAQGGTTTQVYTIPPPAPGASQANMSLLFAVFSITVCPLLASVIAIIFGVTALRMAKPGSSAVTTRAWAGILLALATFVASIVIIVILVKQLQSV